MQKFVNGVTVPGRNTRKGKSTKRALIVDDKKYVWPLNNSVHEPAFPGIHNHLHKLNMFP
jgi:hypothetical protein